MSTSAGERDSNKISHISHVIECVIIGGILVYLLTHPRSA